MAVCRLHTSAPTYLSVWTKKSRQKTQGELSCKLVNPHQPPHQLPHLSHPHSSGSENKRAAMVQSDYDLLIEMGFDPERSRLAVDKTKGRKLRPPPPSLIASLLNGQRSQSRTPSNGSTRTPPSPSRSSPAPRPRKLSAAPLRPPPETSTLTAIAWRLAAQRPVSSAPIAENCSRRPSVRSSMLPGRLSPRSLRMDSDGERARADAWTCAG